MNRGLILAIAAGALLPVVIAVAIVLVRISTFPVAEQPAARRQAARFGLGVAGGIIGGLIVSALVIALVLALRTALGR